MTHEQLQSAIRAKPFRPFKLYAGEHSVRVSHPEAIAHDPTSIDVVVVKPKGGFEVFDLDLISSLKVEPATKKDGRKQ